MTEPKWKPDVKEQTIKIGDPGEAEKMRIFLAEHEVDSVGYVPEETCGVYVRRRAMAVKEVDGAKTVEPPSQSDPTKPEKPKLVPSLEEV